MIGTTGAFDGNCCRLERVLAKNGDVVEVVWKCGCIVFCGGFCMCRCDGTTILL